MARDIATQILKPAAAAASSADPASKQFTEEGVKPAAKIIADNVQPVAQGFTDQTLMPTAQKVIDAAMTACMHSLLVVEVDDRVIVAKQPSNPALHCAATALCKAALLGCDLSRFARTA